MTENIYQTEKEVKVLLLLNAGKENELKGKCRDEIEVSEDMIVSDVEMKLYYY